LSEAVVNEGDAWPVARYPDPILRRCASQVPEGMFGSETLKKAASLLKSTAQGINAVGLTAQQCAVDASIVYLTDDDTTMVNPQIIGRSPEPLMVAWEEYCLVFPSDLRVNLLRDSVVTVEFKTLEGETLERRFEGEKARAVQHELDHDRGILFIDHSELADLPSSISTLEEGEHSIRQSKAFDRSVVCGTRCRNRRELNNQSKTTTKREDILALSRQRAALYNSSSRSSSSSSSGSSSSSKRKKQYTGQIEKGSPPRT